MTKAKVPDAGERSALALMVDGNRLQPDHDVIGWKIAQKVAATVLGNWGENGCVSRPANPVVA